MANKFAEQLNVYQSNVYPAMLQSICEAWDCLPEDLYELGIGFIPVTTFVNKKTKEKKRSNAWWCFPMRDAAGEVTGLHLRSAYGLKVKCSASGSKPGLFYALSESVVDERPMYVHGSHNWVRTMDVGMPCPVCEKPDGCLLSAANPHDPQAVVCIRVKEGANRPMRFGYLHILKDAGIIKAGSVLPKSDLPVIVVEGPSDVTSARRLGFQAIGRFNAESGMDQLRDLCRRRDVLLIGENDKADKYGRRAGIDGWLTAFQTVKGVAKSVVKILPPEDVKDLRQWRKQCALTQDQLLAYVAEHGSSDTDSTVLESSVPLDIAESWLTQCHKTGEYLLLRRHKGQWFRWKDNKYEEIEPDDIVRGGLYRFLNGKKYKDLTPEGVEVIKPYEATRAKISDIVDALNMSCPISGSPPCWVDGSTEPNPGRLLCFQNGVLNVDEYLDGSREIQPASPNLFSLNCLPYDFDPDAECPRWEAWVQEVLGDDARKISLIQEWFGYCMTADMSMEKMMIFQGRTRSGKGTALEVLRAVIGSHQVATTSFGSLCGDFGRAPLVGKLAAFMPDARIPKRADSMQALEGLLAIVGQDGININRKNLPELADHRLMTRFTIAVNELPELPDHSQALEPRLLILHFAKSFKGREDRSLKMTLPHEAPGVALWALKGLERLKKQGVFTIPKSSNNMLDDFRRVTSPIVEFADEFCLVDANNADMKITQAQLFDAWSAWCRERGMQAGFSSRFAQRLTAAYPDVLLESVDYMQTKVKVYKHIQLTPDGQRMLLGKVGR